MSNGFSNAGGASDWCKVVVTHVASEHKWVKLYVQKDYDSVSQIESYIEANEAALRKQSGYLHQGQLPLGTPCFARFSDNKWYRAAVSAWPKSDATFVEVTFIDYGNPEIVSVGDIRIGDEDIFLTPPLAMECFLDGVDVNLIAPKDASQLIEHIKELLLYEEVTLRVVRYEQVSGGCVRPIVSIMLPAGGQLVDVLKATASAPPPPPPVFKHLAVPLESTHEVYVAHLHDMANVYLHLSAKDPTDFTERLQTYCASTTLCPVPTVQEGMACLSRFSEDGSLYRSCVSSVVGSTCKVTFVDYGNSEEKSVQELLSIPPSLLEEPVYAHHCEVGNLTVDVDTFRDVTADVPLTCKFVGKRGPLKYTVELSGIPGLETPVGNGLLPQPMSLQKLHFDPETTFAMYISFIESVEFMYGQLKETVEDIESISTRLAAECQAMPNGTVDARPGAAVACMYEGQWYRAEVVEAAQKVTVWIADYGDTVQLDRSALRPLDQRYLLQPAYALKLTLDGYECDPGNMGAATSALQDLVLDVEARVHVVESLPDGTHVVRIFVGDPPVLVTRKLPSLANSVKVPSPTLSSMERLTVMVVTPPDKFFGQLSKYSVEDLEALQESLLQHYSNAPHDSRFHPVVGQHVCCKFSEDGAFYRAKVTKAEPGGRYGVFYLDYGNEEVVAAESVYPLAAVFTQMPLFGILCRLEGCSSADSVSHLIDTEVEVRLIREDECVHWAVLPGSPVRNVPPPEALPTVPQVLPAVPQPVASAPVVSYEPFSMSPAEMAMGETTSVEVVFVASPAEFYCQQKAHEEELNMLMDAIALLEVAPPLHETSLKVDLPCVSLYSEDGGWYRARVRELRPGGALVFFVDYGNSEEVQCSSLRALPSQHARLPEQAVRCKLAGAQPATGATWSDEATAKFEELVTAQTTTVTVLSKSGNCHDVELTLPDGRAAASVLCQEGFSASLDRGPVNASPSHGSVSDVGFYYKSLVPGTSVQATVSWVISPGEVFIQDVDMADALDVLMEQLQIHYAQSRPEVDPVRAGQACVAKFSEDGMWYRARVTHSKGGKLGVHYVDYGNCEEVPISDVRKIVPSFVELPTQAVWCQIRGLHPPGPSWTAVAPGGPLEDILSDVLTCRPIANQDGLHLVDLERSSDRANVADLLVAAGLAKTAKENCSSASDTSVTSKPRMCIPPVEVSFQAGQYVDVKVTAALSVGEIWCRSLQGLDPITDALAEAAKSTKKLANPVAGDGCVACAPDGQWARAVVRTRVSPAKIEVLFVDIGIVQTLHHAKVKPIVQELMELPAQAFQCCLVADGKDVCVDSLQTLVNRELVLEVKAVRDSCVVGTLFDTTGDDEVNVLDALATKVSAPAMVNGTTSAASEVEAPAPAQAAAPASAGGDAVPEKAQLKPSLNRGHAAVPCYAPVSKLCGKMAAYVMHIDDMNCFYVMRKDQELELENLSTLIMERYAGGEGEQVEPVPKMPCIAMSPADSQWYRARIVNPLDDSRATVHFIDYGNTEETTQLRAVPPEFLEIPPFCYKCRLDGAKELANVPEAAEKFAELVSDVELELEVVTWGHEVTVRLSREGADVLAQLTQYGSVAAPVGQGDDSTEQKVTAEATDDSHAFKTAPVEGEVVCIISHVDSLESFYVYPAEKEDELADFCGQVQDILASESTAIENPQVGTACCALFSEDEQWYRATVLEAGSKIRVRFVDYGNSECVDSVAKIPEQLLCPPPFCFGCKLEGVFKGSDGVSKLKELSEAAERVRVKVVEWGEPAVVRLFSSDGSDIGAQLSAAPPVEGQVEESDVCPEKYVQPDVQLHTKVLVNVSHVNSPLDFYVTLAEHKEKLDEVAAILEEPPSRSEGFEPTVGSPCTALYTDGLTYRATVIKKSETEVGVLFVDYGNRETVAPKDVFCLPASLVTIPALAVHCKLEADEDSVSAEEATQRFRELVEEKTSSLLADFLRKDGDVFVVRLLDMGLDILASITGKNTKLRREEQAEIPVDLVPGEVVADAVVSEIVAKNAEPEQADIVFEEPAEAPEKPEQARGEVDTTSGKDANGNMVQDVEPAVDNSPNYEAHASTEAPACDGAPAEKVCDKLQTEAESVPPGFEAGDTAVAPSDTQEVEHATPANAVPKEEAQIEEHALSEAMAQDTDDRSAAEPADRPSCGLQDTPAGTGEQEPEVMAAVLSTDEAQDSEEQTTDVATKIRAEQRCETTLRDDATPQEAELKGGEDMSNVKVEATESGPGAEPAEDALPQEDEPEGREAKSSVEAPACATCSEKSVTKEVESKASDGDVTSSTPAETVKSLVQAMEEARSTEASTCNAVEGSEKSSGAPSTALCDGARLASGDNGSGVPEVSVDVPGACARSDDANS